MAPSFRRAAARRVPTAAAPAAPAAIAVVPTVITPSSADWGVVGLDRRGEAWRITVLLPGGRPPRSAALVLVGRTSRDETSVPMTVDAPGAWADLAPDLVGRFAGETVDLWVEPSLGQAPTGWHRVAASGPLVAGDGFEPVRWYATAKGNVSVNVAPAPGGNPRRPTITAFADDPDGARLTIADLADGPGQPDLLLVGASTRRQAGTRITSGPGGAVATVSAEHLSPFGQETVDLFVGGAGAGPGPQHRRRVASRIDLDPDAGARIGRRWEWTATGHVSIRRKTPAEAIAEAGLFDEQHYRRQVPDLPAGADPIEHYVVSGAALGLDPAPMFDTTYYRKMNPDVRSNGFAHFGDVGWRELRNPSPEFDLWWYRSTYMEVADGATNPLAHYAARSDHDALSTRPSPTPSHRLGSGFRLDRERGIRRICLFAGYDAEGIVDDYVVDFVSELSRHADVYYWADSPMPDSELEKLAGFTKGAWAVRHGEYDFGSYARLAAAVGWETIEQYDELLLVNDSCYLLRPLADVFERMDAKACDWWGLQATKGIAQTRRSPANQFRDPIPMESVRTSLVDAFERDYIYDFLIGSYFLAYRKPVIDDPAFRRYLAAVTTQDSKRNIIKTYEIGLTRWLIHHGHPFDTFVSNLYPFHPIFTDWYFRLLDEGFPVLKRFFLAVNHYHVPELWRWADRVREKIPGADIATIERNLARVTEPEALRRRLQIGGGTRLADGPVPEHLLSDREFVEADRSSPKHAGWWAFPVSSRTGQLGADERAIFEAVKDDPSIRKIVLTRHVDVAVDGVAVEVLPLQSPAGQHALMRCATILLSRSRDDSVVYPVASELHNLIRVGSDVPITRPAPGVGDEAAIQEHARCRAVISSSKAAALATTAVSYPLTIDQVWPTGLPRNDFILRDEAALPRELSQELAALREQVGGRTLVLFMPTFRNAQTDGYYQFEAAEIAWLGEWLTANDAVLGVREHMADDARPYSAQLAALPTIDLSDDQFPNVEVLYRVSAALITDYSSAFIDYMLTGKPAISFAYDREAYLMRGTFYDLDLAFPGPVCTSFTDLQAALEAVLTEGADPAYELKRRLFFDHVDDRSAVRVVERIRDLTEAHGVGKWPGERSAWADQV